MTEKNFTTMIEGLNPDVPNAYVFIIQAGNPGGEALTEGQIDASLNAAKSVLELLGSEVVGTCSILSLDPIGDNERGRLLVDCRQEIFPNEAVSVETLADAISSDDDTTLDPAEMEEAE